MPKRIKHRELYLLKPRPHLMLHRVRYQALLYVVASKANRDEAFYNSILNVIQVPSNDWGMRMYDQLRNRLIVTFARFDQGSSNASNFFDVINTSTRLKSLIEAIESMTENVNWRKMEHQTRACYFGLLLDVLRYVVARDRDHRGSRSGSGGSSPYVVNTAMNYNLYQRMVGVSHCQRAMVLLADLYTRLDGPLGPGLPDLIRALLDTVKTRDRSHSTTESRAFVESLRKLRDGKSTVSVCPSSPQIN
jgi:hypothetical protein